MKILNYVQLIDSVRSNRTELFKKKYNNQKIRKSSGTVRRDKIELVRLSSVRFDSIRFENLLKFDSFTVGRLTNSFLYCEQDKTKLFIR